MLVESATDLTVVGEAETGTDAVAQALETHPDVVLMDLSMPGLGGVEATRRIVTGRPRTRVLILTMFEEDESVFAAMRAGARGYLLKGAARDEVLRAVRTIAAGEATFGPAIAERLTSYFASAADGAPSCASRREEKPSSRPGRPGSRRRAGDRSPPRADRLCTTSRRGRSTPTRVQIAPAGSA